LDLDVAKSIPLIDVHTHINFEKPTAKDPSQILLYHYIATELRSIGVPIEEVKAKSDDPVRDLLPYFKFIRNTATYWCLRQILSDLYEFHEDPRPENWNKLKEVIVDRAESRGWAEKLLKEKLNVKKIFLTIDPLVELKMIFNKELYVASLRLDPLVGGLSRENITALEKISGSEASNLDGFHECLLRRFKRLRDLTATATVAFQSPEVYVPTNRALGKEVYEKLYRGRPLLERDLRILRSIALSVVLDVCRELKLPIQIMIGVIRDLPRASPPDYAIALKQDGLLELCRFFSIYEDVPFHLISAYRFQSHELTIIAKNYPNVYLTGYWWYCFYPESIAQHLLERLQLLPMSKICGFFSDAYVLEWIYGKTTLVRKMTSEALESMVRRGFYSEELAEEICKAIFLENPKRFYKL